VVYIGLLFINCKSGIILVSICYKCFMSNKFFLAAIIVSSLAITSCNKNHDEATPQSSDITYQLTTTGSSSVPGRLGTDATTASTERIESGSLVWTSGYITTSEIKFKAHGDDKLEYKSKAVQRIDLFNAIATLGSITIPAGTYKKIDFKIAIAPSGPDAAFELNGYFINNGVQVPIVLRIDEPLEFKFQMNNTPVTIDPNVGFSALHTLALDWLTSGITLPMLSNAVLTNNVVVISSASGSNGNLFKLILHSMQGGIVKVEVKKH
jgi:hypothetical protein